MQAEQTLSVDEVPAVETYWPAAQVDQAAQLVALAPLVKPLVQAEQTRLAVAVPAVETN